ncbi:DUF2968 domain-containing protein [Burkholderia ubonensis]|uniref:DUF2968 domain-containing protein n=1 Tax=Burkholderia ubonensis TaxID=101571 RepID=UPI0009B3B30D|nr:DUF2968 domain-containing protein [Burkholderia ubonensis]
MISTLRHTSLAFAITALCGISFGAWGQAASAPDSIPMQSVGITAAAPDEASSAGNVYEVQKLLAGGGLAAVVRSTLNGSYGSQLLFDRQSGMYYAVLLQQGKVWRVAKTKDEGRAIAVYRVFSRNTEQFSRTEMRQTRLEAQRILTEQQLDQIRERENRLQADLRIAREQTAMAANREEAARTEVDELRAQQKSAVTTLRQTEAQVGQLERQLNAGLPREHTGHKKHKENKRHKEIRLRPGKVAHSPAS